MRIFINALVKTILVAVIIFRLFLSCLQMITLGVVYIVCNMEVAVVSMRAILRWIMINSNSIYVNLCNMRHSCCCNGGWLAIV